MPAKKNKTSQRLLSYGFMLINTLCWGAALIIAKSAFETTTPFRFLFYRFTLASIIVIPLLWKYAHTITNLPFIIRKIIPLEVLGTTISLSLLYFGLARTGAIQASLIASTTPIWIVIGGVILLKEKEEKHEVTGLILATIGTMLLILFPIFNNYSSTKSEISLQGDLIVLLSMMTVAIYYVLAKKHYRTLPKLLVASISFVVGAVTMLPLVIWENWGAATPLIQTIINDLSNLNVLLAAMYMAIFGSIIGLTAYIKGQDGIEASEAGLFTYLQPLIYLPLGFLLLGEKIFSIQILALLIILIGVVIAEKRIKRS